MQNSKAETRQILAISTLALEVKHGHLKWKVTDLSKKSGFSRTIIYAYFGASKTEILRAALSEFLNSFYGLDLKALGDGVGSQVQNVRKFLQEHPEPILFYQFWRSRKGSWIHRDLARAEAKFRRRLQQQYPHLTGVQVLLVHATLHGMVTAPFLNAKGALKGGEELDRLLRKGRSSRSPA